MPVNSVVVIVIHSVNAAAMIVMNQPAGQYVLVVVKI
jgi:hypothetical protein